MACLNVQTYKESNFLSLFGWSLKIKVLWLSSLWLAKSMALNNTWATWAVSFYEGSTEVKIELFLSGLNSFLNSLWNVPLSSVFVFFPQVLRDLRETSLSSTNSCILRFSKISLLLRTYVHGEVEKVSHFVYLLD